MSCAQNEHWGEGFFFPHYSCGTWRRYQWFKLHFQSLKCKCWSRETLVSIPIMDTLKWLQQRTKWEGRRMSLIQKQMELFKVLQLATISNVHSMQKINTSNKLTPALVMKLQCAILCTSISATVFLESNVLYSIFSWYSCNLIGWLYKVFAERCFGHC